MFGLNVRPNMHVLTPGLAQGETCLGCALDLTLSKPDIHSHSCPTPLLTSCCIPLPRHAPPSAQTRQLEPPWPGMHLLYTCQMHVHARVRDSSAINPSCRCSNRLSAWTRPRRSWQPRGHMGKSCKKSSQRSMQRSGDLTPTLDHALLVIDTTHR